MRKKLSIDTSILSDLDLGLDAIAYTADPAIEILGIAFNKVYKSKFISNQKIKFVGDEKKLQIAGAIMIPKDIYRYDSEMGEYDIVFNSKNIEDLTKQLMEKLPQLGVESIFNDEHLSDKKISAFIYQILYVSDEKEVEYIKSKYNYDMPIGGTFIVTQVKDKKTYDYLVENNKIGFSVEGLFKLDEIIESQLNKNKKINMKKEFVYKQNKFTSEPSEISIDGELTVGTGVIAKDEAGEIMENWSGELVIDEKEVTVIDGIITEIEGVELEDEKSEEEKLEDEKSEEELEDEKSKEEELEGEVITEERVLEIVNEQLDFLIKRISELEKIITETPKVETETELTEEEKEKINSDLFSKNLKNLFDYLK